jgi:hypothetical protein
MAPAQTHWVISIRCSFISSTFTCGMMIVAPVWRSGQMAPNK